MTAKLKVIRRDPIPFSKFSFEKLVSVIENLSLDIILEAKATHRFTSRSNYLERSIKNRIVQKHNKIISFFSLDNRIANYGKYIHEGFRTWKSDPFLFNAIDNKTKNLKKLISQKVKEMK